MKSIANHVGPIEHYEDRNIAQAFGNYRPKIATTKTALTSDMIFQRTKHRMTSDLSKQEIKNIIDTQIAKAPTAYVKQVKWHKYVDQLRFTAQSEILSHKQKPNSIQRQRAWRFNEFSKTTSMDLLKHTEDIVTAVAALNGFSRRGILHCRACDLKCD